MNYKPKVGERVRATPTIVTTAPAEAFREGGLQSTIEGEVVSVNEGNGTIVVRDGDGDLSECYNIAFPLGTVIEATLGRDIWEARIKGRQTPMANGASKDEAVQKLKMHFPSFLFEPVTVE